MNRGNSVAVGVIVLVIALLIYLSYAFGSKNDASKWMFKYEYDNAELAYDRDFFIDFVKKDVGSTNFERLDERLSRQENLDSNSLYLFYNRKYNIDTKESEALMDFVKKGNSAVVIAEQFSHKLFKSLRGVQFKSNIKESLTYNLNYDSAIYLTESVTLFNNEPIPVEFIVYGASNPFGNSFTVDTSDVSNDYFSEMPEELEYYDGSYDEDEAYLDDSDDYYTDDDEYYEDEYYEDEPIEDYEVELDDNLLKSTSLDFTKPVDVSIEIIGRTKQNGANLLKIKYGEGYLYLHCTPGLFTNVQLDKPEMFGYMQDLFAEIEYDQVYLDELKFQFLNKKNPQSDIPDQSYFEYIFKNKALKTAFFFCLIGILIFLIAGIKRKQNAIEVVDPITNSSIEFTKTIARLYWLNPNHKRMAEQKMNMFLFEVRNRYGLVTHDIGEEFREKFQAKSGVPEKHIKRLFNAYVLTLEQNTIHADTLTQISEEIVNIKKSWK